MDHVFQKGAVLKEMHLDEFYTQTSEEKMLTTKLGSFRTELFEQTVYIFRKRLIQQQPQWPSSKLNILLNGSLNICPFLSRGTLLFLYLYEEMRV